MSAIFYMIKNKFNQISNKPCLHIIAETHSLSFTYVNEPLSLHVCFIIKTDDIYSTERKNI